MKNNMLKKSVICCGLVLMSASALSEEVNGHEVEAKFKTIYAPTATYFAGVRSEIEIACHHTGVARVEGNLGKSASKSQPLTVYTSDDSGATWTQRATFTTDAKGNGEFEFNLSGLAPGPHSTVVAINGNSDGTNPGGTQYINPQAPYWTVAGPNAPATGLVYTCPVDTFPT